MIALVLALAVFAGVGIAHAVRNDRWVRTIEAMDDEELAAALAEFPDLLTRRGR